MLSLFACALIVAQFESIHGAIHPDSTEPGHHCVATLIQSGQLDHAIVTAEPVFIPARLFAAPIRNRVFHRQFVFSLQRNRGPPVS